MAALVVDTAPMSAAPATRGAAYCAAGCLSSRGIANQMHRLHELRQFVALNRLAAPRAWRDRWLEVACVDGPGHHLAFDRIPIFVQWRRSQVRAPARPAEGRQRCAPVVPPRSKDQPQQVRWIPLPHAIVLFVMAASNTSIRSDRGSRFQFTATLTIALGDSLSAAPEISPGIWAPGPRPRNRASGVLGLIALPSTRTPSRRPIAKFSSVCNTTPKPIDTADNGKRFFFLFRAISIAAALTAATTIDTTAE